jgi:hypothetical protein
VRSTDNVHTILKHENYRSDMSVDKTTYADTMFTIFTPNDSYNILKFGTPYAKHTA